MNLPRRSPSISTLHAAQETSYPTSERLECATETAWKIIRKNVSEKGLAASIDIYPQVWARDTAITFLGAISDAQDILAAFRNSVETLESHQDRFGQIPNYVCLADNTATYGSLDATLWFVVAACVYGTRADDPAWLEKRFASIVKALDWCEMRDFQKCGLVSSMEADDWADLMCHRGHVLFANALRIYALRKASAVYQSSHPESSTRWKETADCSIQAARTAFWVAPPGSFSDTTHVKMRTLASIRLRELPFFLPWVNMFEFGERFDAPGNLLAILSQVATQDQALAILAYIRQEGIDKPYPVRALHPVIHPTDKDWRDYYMVWGHGQPYHYLNGGIWPWVGGLYVTALVYCKEYAQANAALVELAKSLHLGKQEPWEFNEWLHGQSGNPMGAKFQAWSAGMFLYARHCVTTRSVPDFL